MFVIGAVSEHRTHHLFEHLRRNPATDQFHLGQLGGPLRRCHDKADAQVGTEGFRKTAQISHLLNACQRYQPGWRLRVQVTVEIVLDNRAAIALGQFQQPEGLAGCEGVPGGVMQQPGGQVERGAVLDQQCF